MVTYKRKQIRLKKYDYSDAGWYFVTICIQDTKCLLGDIINNQMNLNGFGNVINQYWLNIPNHFNNVELDEYVIMPNHIHGIIVIRNSLVGARSPRPLGFPRPLLGQIVVYFKYK